MKKLCLSALAAVFTAAILGGSVLAAEPASDPRAVIAKKFPETKIDDIKLSPIPGIYQVPVIEDEVQLGVGAKVLGPVRVARGAIVGANAVVLQDVPAGAVVGGIPARILRMRETSMDESLMLETGLSNTGT